MTMDTVAGCGDVYEAAGCDSCIARSGDGIGTGATLKLPNTLKDITSIDYAVQLTIADMPNALKLLENS